MKIEMIRVICEAHSPKDEILERIKEEAEACRSTDPLAVLHKDLLRMDEDLSQCVVSKHQWLYTGSILALLKSMLQQITQIREKQEGDAKEDYLRHRFMEVFRKVPVDSTDSSYSTPAAPRTKRKKKASEDEVQTVSDKTSSVSPPVQKDEEVSVSPPVQKDEEVSVAPLQESYIEATDRIVKAGKTDPSVLNRYRTGLENYANGTITNIPLHHLEDFISYCIGS